MAIVYVARHGETDWNREGRYQGRRNSHLTALGRRQARALGAALAGSHARRVVTSPLERCVETGRPAAQALGLTARTDARLIEISHGTWTGRLRADLEREDPERLHAWRTTPDTVRFDHGESLDDVAARWRDFAGSLDREGDSIVVTHDPVIRVAILLATGRPLRELWKPRVLNGAYARFSVDAGGWHLEEGCHDAHLEGMIAETSAQAL